MNSLTNKILDKINKVGLINLSYDERIYLKQLDRNAINPELENWLNSDEWYTYDNNGNKLLFDEFEENEDIFNNYVKLKRVISKILNKKPFTNNADWGGADVWGLRTNDNFTGLFIYLGEDDNLLLLKININKDEDYENDIKEIITDNNELNQLLIKYL
jgi:hypothetical protein